MQPDVRFLNGIWEGTSVPFRRDKESTKWVDCDLSFESSSVTGTGTSQWCGQNISFRISGKYDASTGIFEITKKHEGKFMNVLLFRGRIDFERRELRGQYRSGNFYLVQTTARPPKPSVVDSKRVLHPRPTIQQTGHSLSHLSGGWDGEYISHKRREITIWRNCSLEFTLQSGQGQFGKLEGQGESLWRGEVIPFKLTGTFDLKQLWVDLLKTHTGKYTNTGQYRMSLDLKHVQMTGDDGYGVLTLKKFSGHSTTTSTTTTSSYLPSASSPSTPTRPISPSSQNSRGPLSPSMPGLESYRRAVPNSSQSGGNNGGPTGQSFFRSQSIPSSSSVSRSSSTTSTEDFFEKENNKNQLKTVDYDDFDSSSLEITRLKLGKLTTEDLSTTPKSTTTIIENTPAQEKFICYLDGMISHTPSSTIPPSMIQDKRVTKDMYILSAKQSQAISDFRFKHKISEDDNKLVLSQLKIVDVYSTTMYDSTPTISYEKRRSFTREDELSPTTYSPHPRSTYPSTRSSRLLSGSSRGGGGSETGGDSNSVSGDSVAETEQSSIGGSGGGGDEPYVSATGEPDVGHDAYAFYEPEPQSGVKEVPSPVSPNVEEESADLCKVCFDAKMNCVIVPCGHFSICMKCAILLTNCPVCRGKIEQRQLVYRA